MLTGTGIGGVDAEKQPSDQIVRIGNDTRTDAGGLMRADKPGSISGKREIILPYSVSKRKNSASSTNRPIDKEKHPHDSHESD